MGPGDPIEEPEALVGRLKNGRCLDWINPWAWGLPMGAIGINRESLQGNRENMIGVIGIGSRQYLFINLT